jgi:hypothetical protein
LKPRIREDKDEVAKCPFCSEFLSEPEPIKTALGEGIGGRCSCGAVYSFDPTGHNVGEAYLDALALAYGEGWNRIPEDSYDEVVLQYDARTGKLSAIREMRRLEMTGKIVFIKVRDGHE